MTSESLAGVKSPIRKTSETDEPKPKKEVAPDFSALQSSLNGFELSAPEHVPESPAQNFTPPVIEENQEELNIKNTDLSVENAEPVKSHQTLSTVPKKKNPAVGLGIACFILLVLVGGSYYAWKAGMLNGILPPKDDPEQTVNTPVQPEDTKPVTEKKVRFSTIQDASEKMAYCAAISGHLGTMSSVSKYKTYRVIGTPVDASIYVDNSLICAKSPCAVHYYGDPAKAQLEIRKGTQKNTYDLSKHDPKTPVIIVIGK